MENLYFNPTEDTPLIAFNKDSGVLELSGRSLPEDVVDFYNPVYEWLDSYSSHPSDKTIVKMRIDYFNSASQRVLNEILIILTRITLKEKEVLVEWYYMEEDEEIRELGEELEEISHLPFKYMSYTPE